MKYTPASKDEKFSMEEIMVRLRRALDDCRCLNGEFGRENWIRIDDEDAEAFEQWHGFMQERLEARKK